MKNKRSRPFRRTNSNRNHSDNFNTGNNGARVRGSLSTVLEKYKNLAKDAMSSGDHIGAENYLQHAEHYTRVINIKNEKNVNGNSFDNKNDLKNKDSEVSDSSDKEDSNTNDSNRVEA
mgnify:CR=1 FL=1